MGVRSGPDRPYRGHGKGPARCRTFSASAFILSAVSTFVGDHQAYFVDVLADVVDLFGPGAAGGVRVGQAFGVLALGFCEGLGEVFETLLEGGTGHGRRVSLGAVLLT